MLIHPRRASSAYGLDMVPDVDGDTARLQSVAMAVTRNNATLLPKLEWIADHDPWAALDMGDAIHAAVGRLAEDLATAWGSRVTGTRVVVVGTPYIVVYRIDPSAVVIGRVLHTAQRWPRD